MYLPYGVNEQGQLVYIDSVGRGRTALKCPYCGVLLIARKGERLAPHFAHDGKTCREAKRSGETVALPVYDSFRLHLSGRVWEALRMFHDEGDDSDGDWLKDYGLVKSFISPYGNERYALTHKGKIPFGDLSLNLFNQFQEPLIQARHDELERKALEAFGREDESTTLTDLRLFRAQMRRILEATLYFIEARTGEGVLYKIGVTTRSLEQRLAEIRLDLTPHFGTVELIPLGTWAHRGNVELYFKHRYRRFQHPIGTLTEYFAFEDIKAVLRDLRRMKSKELAEVEQTVLSGEPSRVERRDLAEHEILSREAWWLLCNLSFENSNRYYGTWHELHNYRWAGEHRRLIEPVKDGTECRLQMSAFGTAYRTAFERFYQRHYHDAEVPT